MRDLPEITCVTFEEGLRACSVADEVGTLSRESLEVLLGHVAQVLKGKIDPFKLQWWRRFDDIPLIKVEYAGELLVYAAERASFHGQRKLKVSIMFAGNRQNGYSGYDVVWHDGADDSLWTDVIEPRCAVHFA